MTRFRPYVTGTLMKDYFWISDLEPRMIMHPYVKELIGKKLDKITDLHGKKLFLDAIDATKKNGEGFISYTWQWNDKFGKPVPKTSFVKLFKPWGWIIGTGMYINDVNAEIRRYTFKATLISIFILMIIVSVDVFYSYELCGKCGNIGRIRFVSKKPSPSLFIVKNLPE